MRLSPGRTGSSGLTLPLAVALVYVGFTVLILLRFRAGLTFPVHANPIEIANEIAEASRWLSAWRRLSALVSVLLVLWLWLLARPLARRRGLGAAAPYLAVSALLAATQLLVVRAIEAVPQPAFELIRVWP